MARPQQPEIAGSQSAPVDPDRVDPAAETQGRPAPAGRVGGVPADNQPGHHPSRDQDKPDGAAFLAKMRSRGQATGDDDTGAPAAGEERP